MTRALTALTFAAALMLAQTASACPSDTFSLFACEAANGRKFIELCASTPLSADQGSLVYRFGALDANGSERAVEFEFPSDGAGSLKHFVGATYTHQGVYTQSLRFVSGAYSYAVFTRAKGRQTIEAGVEVRDQRTGRSTVVACHERPRFYIHELRGLVACDAQTPVGKACIR